jgi:hypothetical protein
MKTSVSACVTAGMMLLTSAWAQEVALTPVADATLYESSVGALANGAGDHLFVGVTIREGTRRRSVVRFEAAGAVPAGSRVEAVTLRVTVSRTLRDMPTVVSIHGVTRAWSEGPADPDGEEGAGTDAGPGDCTWIHTVRPGTLWANAGGDFGAAASSRVVDGPGVYEWASTPGLVALVQGWVDAPSGNHGMLFKGDELMAGTAKRFESREFAEAGARPTLIVRYACGADFNGDGFVDFFDYDAFVACFEGSACPPDRDADFNRDGFVDFFDYDAFVELFETGC